MPKLEVGVNYMEGLSAVDRWVKSIAMYSSLQIILGIFSWAYLLSGFALLLEFQENFQEPGKLLEMNFLKISG